MLRYTKPNRPPAGIYVPPPREKPRPITERVAAVKSRAQDKTFLDAEQTAPPGKSLSVILSEEKAALQANLDHKLEAHRNFLANSPTVQQVRTYVELDGPRSVIGEWQEPYIGKDGKLHPGGLEFHHRENEVGYAGQKDFNERYLNAIDTERRCLVEFLKDEIFEWVCEDGYSWQQKCPACDARDKLRRKGLPEERIEEILSFQNTGDLKPGDRRGSRDVNILLGAEGLGKWAGTNKLITCVGNGVKLGQIDAASQRDKEIGGKKVTASSQRINLDTGERNKGANGPDSYDSAANIAAGNISGGSQANSQEPNYVGARTLKQLGLTKSQMKKDFRIMLEEDVRFELQSKPETAALPYTKFEALVKKEVKKRVVKEYAAYLALQKRLNGEQADAAAALPLETNQAGHIDEGYATKRLKGRKLPPLPKFDSVAATETHDEKPPTRDQIPLPAAATDDETNEEGDLND